MNHKRKITSQDATECHFAQYGILRRNINSQDTI